MQWRLWATTQGHAVSVAIRGHAAVGCAAVGCSEEVDAKTCAAEVVITNGLERDNLRKIAAGRYLKL